ncbi:MAG: hypothetical protein J1E43_03405 [Christensenellaceae bacterium]|nr:hypothetical protein [Christensenellaceae bacterium]
MKKLVCLLLVLTMALCSVGAALGDDAQTSSTEGLLRRGTVDGFTYENTTLGYGCVLENWTFADGDDLAMKNGWAEDILSDDARTPRQRHRRDRHVRSLRGRHDERQHSVPED